MTEMVMPDDVRFLEAAIRSGGDQSAYWLERLYKALIRQEIPNPSVLNVNPGFTWSTTARMRGWAICFSGGTASNVMGLKVGSAIAFDWVVPSSPGVWTVPLPLQFDAGVDVLVVDVTTPGSTNWKCRLFAYTEVDI